jgi:DNA/RNA-binding protein KIN17
MNSTQWETLTDFVKWMGKEGHCVVDETEKGWFIQYVDRDPEAIRRQESVLKKEKMDMDDEERRARFIQQQIERSKRDEDEEVPVYTELQRDDDDEKVAFKLPLAPASKKSSQQPVASTSSAFADLDKKAGSSRSKQDDASRKRKSALEEIREMEEMKKKKISSEPGEVENIC